MFQYIPNFKASSAVIWSPVRHISIALDFPTALGKRCVPPAPGIVPGKYNLYIRKLQIL